MITSDMIAVVYRARQTRLLHPDGTFDKAGRWNFSADELCVDSSGCDHCGHIRQPSRAWPYSYMVHARTKKHIAVLAAIRPEYFMMVYAEAVRAAG